MAPALDAPPKPAKALSGPAKAMAKLGLRSDVDLALHLPLRYEDETRLTPIAALRDGEMAQVEGNISDCHVETRSRRQLLVRLRDDSGEVLLRFLHFYASQLKTLAVGVRLRVRGEARGGFFGREMVHPTFKLVSEDTPLPTALTPVYPSSAQLPQAYLRKAIASALARAPLAELLPAGCLPAGLPPLREALMGLHQPSAQTTLAALQDRSQPAWQRLKFEELLAQQLSQALAKRERATLHAPVLNGQVGEARQSLCAGLRAVLPFALTSAQQRVIQEITADLARGQPMHRLLQGDVGSGKTVVAALAAAIAMDSGWQCALMAPTEILAEQHFRKLIQWLEPLLQPKGLGIAWLTGSRKGKARTQMIERVASGEAALVVGTHAVIQADVHFARLGLAIIDEQHRFGVQQRLALRHKLVSRADGGARPLEPHLLMMTATPIPRTLAMSYFADLDLSTIDELPPGRTPVLTKVFADSRRDEVIARIRDELQHGRQVYWVCPLIEDNGAAAEADAGAAGVKVRQPGRSPSEALELRNVTQTHAELSAALPGRTVGLLHGRMAGADKAAAMARFAAGELQVLVSTTVIEVGVDVANASLMVIEHAERFGLSQLHQLRGRVGRGTAASACVLLYGAALSATGKARLKAMLDTQDGFEIARRDLDIRGPGEFMGARQSGDALLRFADLAQDQELLLHARRIAAPLLKTHPDVAQRHVQRWLGGGAEFLKA